MTRLRVEPFRTEHIPAVSAFNGRLARGGIGWRFPEHPVPDWLPAAPGCTIFQEYFLLLEDNHVRGAYMLTHREMCLSGAVRKVGNVELPLSEGTVNPAYSMVAYQLLSDARRRQPLLFGVGLGGQDVRITRLVRSMGWRIRTVPFFFRVVHGARFCGQLSYLRTNRLRSLLLDLAAATGLGWAASKTASLLLTRRSRNDALATAEVVDRFGDWVEDLWCSSRERYPVIGARDQRVLNRIHVTSNPFLRRLRITSGGRVLGYAVVEDRQMVESEFFGNLRVGTIMDCLARPEDAGAVIKQSVRQLEQWGVDLIVSNQSHAAWSTALRDTGFLPGPSNFLLATAPALTELFDAADPDGGGVHLNRGDGPWPSGLGFRVDRARAPSARERRDATRAATSTMLHTANSTTVKVPRPDG